MEYRNPESNEHNCPRLQIFLFGRINKLRWKHTFDMHGSSKSQGKWELAIQCFKFLYMEIELTTR